MKTLATILAILLLSTPHAYAGETSLPIGILKTNQHTIIIQYGIDEPLYTVHSHEGAVVAVKLPESKLVTILPYVKNLLKTGIADWAGMNPGYRKSHSTNRFN